ncbi:hypothetical protein [Burkholderia sp. Ac-20379]|uniref:hypothetical protein n=1 Tax=Burkholderia sp. Ac-20379 TaxID=2703900 RepID=UPI00197FDF5C|nr:hypothetical protein [Burkholderia sp. Ac-20379]MBN3724434.1 hypothetical protein [Burkholderia sp. Ac-20379]
MSQPWVEKRGGLWINRAETCNELVVEEYDDENDAFLLIWRRASDGLYTTEYLVKGKAHRDPQYVLPFWGNIARAGLFGSISDARAHASAIALAYRQKHSDA